MEPRKTPTHPLVEPLKGTGFGTASLVLFFAGLVAILNLAPSVALAIWIVGAFVGLVGAVVSRGKSARGFAGLLINLLCHGTS